MGVSGCDVWVVVGGGGGGGGIADDVRSGSCDGSGREGGVWAGCWGVGDWGVGERGEIDVGVDFRRCSSSSA